jgi:hypothetical protein
MIATLPLILVSSFTPLSTAPLAVHSVSLDDLEERMTAAGEDVEKLWEIRLWLVDEGRDEEARNVVKKILEIDADHEASHRALSHHNYDGKWFESYSALSKYRREEEKRMREEHGKVRFGDGWALETDVPYLRMGWIKQEDGSWADGKALERQAAEDKMIADGYQLRPEDSTWVHPDEFEKWTGGLWKCGEVPELDESGEQVLVDGKPKMVGNWLPTDAANEYHAQIGTRWEYQSEHYLTHSTCDNEAVTWAGWWADRTYGDLVKILGVKPAEKPVVVVLNGVQQYNQFAGGDQALGLPATETTGHSSVHYAYFAEAWFDLSDQTAPRYMGSGVGWWDKSDPGLANFGQHSIRHAAAHSFIEAVDPSWNAVSAVVAAGAQVNSLDAFWAEKKLPKWLRYGAASYVERFFIDDQVGEGGNPMWAREWALTNMRDKGGLRTLERVFEFNLDANDITGSAQLINEAGLVIAFILDGECKPVIDAHQKLKAMLKAGEDTKEALEELQEALIKNEKKLRKFAS